MYISLYEQAFFFFFNNFWEQETVKEVVPIDYIKEKKKEIIENGECTLDNIELHDQEAFIRSLMKWFKFEFFTWTDSPKCSFCQVNIIYYRKIQNDLILHIRQKREGQEWDNQQLRI